MIEFRCKSCGRALRVRAQYAGKSIRCPQCKAVAVVPSADSRIRFRCSNCNQGMSVSKASANRNIKCPKCGVTITVPGPSVAPPEQEEKADVRFEQPPTPSHSATDKISSAPDTINGEMHPYFLYRKTGEDENTGERKLPWFVDIFLYPVSTSGLLITAVVIVLPMLINITAIVFRGFGFFVALPGVIIKAITAMYLFWYIMNSIEDSARGGTRAASILGNSPNLNDMFGAIFRTLICLAFFMAPMLIYKGKTARSDAVFWGLAGYAIFFFPMGLLSTLMFDSFRGLNPILLVQSVFSAFVPYLGLVLVYFGLFTYFHSMDFFSKLPMSVVTINWSGKFLGNYALFIWSSLVCAHLLGRFYYRYEEKLYWDA